MTVLKIDETKNFYTTPQHRWKTSLVDASHQVPTAAWDRDVYLLAYQNALYRIKPEPAINGKIKMRS